MKRFILLLAFTLVISAQNEFLTNSRPEEPVSKSTITNLQDIANDFARNYCVNTAHRSAGCTRFVDLQMTQDYDKKYQSSNYPVTIESVNNMQYQVIEQTKKPSLILTQTYNNTNGETPTMHFSKSQEVDSTAEWSITAGMKYTTSVSVTAGIPDLASTTFTETIELDFSATTSQSTTHKQTWGITDDIPVPPMTYLKATYTVIEQDFKANWGADIKFCGVVSVWFNDQYDVNHDGNKHWLWFLPVTYVFWGYENFQCPADNFSVPYSAEDMENGNYDARMGKNGENSCCYYKAKGTYSGIGGAASHVQTDSKPCCSAEQPFYGEVFEYLQH